MVVGHMSFKVINEFQIKTKVALEEVVSWNHIPLDQTAWEPSSSNDSCY